MNKYRVGIIGAGTLGSVIAEEIKKELANYYTVIGFLDRNSNEKIKYINGNEYKLYVDIDSMMNDSPNFVIEAAGKQALLEYSSKIISSGASLIPLSVGGFSDEVFYNSIISEANKYGAKIYIPSGAVGGFDVLQTAMLMGVNKVSLVTEKSPESLHSAPFFKGKSLEKDKKRLVFSGTASEAIKYFPDNINVAVALAISTKGVNETMVEIISVPGRVSNKHTITLEGENIRVSLTTESIPTKDNPKSSLLAAYSVITVLKRIISPIKI